MQMYAHKKLALIAKIVLILLCWLSCWVFFPQTLLCGQQLLVSAVKLLMNTVVAVQKTNYTVGCIQSSVATRARKELLFPSHEIPSGALHPALASSEQEGHGPVSPEKGHQDDHRNQTPLLEWKLEKVETVQPWRGKALGKLYCGFLVPEGGL